MKKYQEYLDTSTNESLGCYVSNGLHGRSGAGPFPSGLSGKGREGRGREGKGGEGKGRVDYVKTQPIPLEKLGMPPAPLWMSYLIRPCFSLKLVKKR